jgi:hypothetical protein
MLLRMQVKCYIIDIRVNSEVCKSLIYQDTTVCVHLLILPAKNLNAYSHAHFLLFYFAVLCSSRNAVMYFVLTNQTQICHATSQAGKTKY